MDRQHIELLIQRHGGKLVRSRRHLVYKFPDGRCMSLSKTPSDHLAELNNMTKLRRFLGIEREVHKNPDRRPKAGASGRPVFAATARSVVMRDWKLALKSMEYDLPEDSIMKPKGTLPPSRSLKIVDSKMKPKGAPRSVQALKRLGVSADQLAAAPQITPMLKRANGGLTQVIASMRFSPDALVTAFLQKYDAVPVGDREYLSMEAIALAAGIDIPHLLGSIMVALQVESVSAVKIIALTSHPDITQARVMYGKLPLGERDRTALDTAMGFLPSPKGPTFIGKAVFASGNGDAQGCDDDEDDFIDMNALFPAANSTQEKLAAIRNRNRQLTPGDERKPN